MVAPGITSRIKKNGGGEFQVRHRGGKSRSNKWEGEIRKRIKLVFLGQGKESKGSCTRESATKLKEKPIGEMIV